MSTIIEVISLNGYPGPVGPQGLQGIQGIQGIQGVQGPPGVGGGGGGSGTTMRWRLSTEPAPAGLVGDTLFTKTVTSSLMTVSRLSTEPNTYTDLGTFNYVPSGGTDGQALSKVSGAIAWADNADPDGPGSIIPVTIPFTVGS